MKKMLALLLTLCLLAGMVPLGAGAEESTSCTGGDTCDHAAAIGDTYYDTLQEAINAATPGATVTLCNDIHPSDPITVSKTLTLDLADHEISNTSAIWNETEKHWSLIRVSGEGNLTITGNGTLEALENDCYAVDLFDTTSKCTIENGTFIGNIHAVYVYNGNLTVNGGTFSVNQKYSSKYPDEYVLNCNDDSYKNRTASITVNGGTFLGFNPQNCRAEGEDTNFCAEGYVGVIEKTEGKNTYYTVKPLSEVAVAKTADGKMYTTLAEAVDVAQDNDTVTLLKEITDQALIELGTGKDVTINLNGFNIGFAGSSYFKVKGGKLHLTGRGKVYEKEPYDAPIKIWGSAADVANYSVVTVDEDVTLEGWAGIFITVNPDGSGVNHAFGVKVTVDGTINSVEDTSGNDGHGVYINGMNQDMNGNVPQITLGPTSKITSTGNGIYAAGYAVWDLAGDITAPDALSIKSGTFNITGGTYHSTGGFADPAAANSNGSENTGAALSITSNKSYAKKTEVNVTGGTFISDNGYAVYEGIAKKEDVPAADRSYATISISGGTFQGGEGKDAVSITEAQNKQVISGGYFTSDPSAYCPEGRTGVANTGSNSSTYPFTVGESIVDVETAVAAGVPTVSVPQKIGVTEDAVREAAQAKATQTSLQNAAKLAGLSNNEDVVGTEKEATKALEDENVTVAEGATVTVVVQPYLDVAVKSATTTGETKSMTVDISAKYNVIATTADDPEDIELEGTEPGTSKNAVIIEEKKDMTVTSPVTITLPLPANFVTADTTPIFVQHKGYEYEAEVTSNGETTATFTNPHGFSTFVLSTKSETVATVDGTNYTNFQQAVNAVGPNGTIEVKANDQTATGVTHRLTLKNSDPDKAITVTINGETITIPAGGTKTFTYTAPTPPRPTEEKHSITISTDGKGQVTGPASATEDDKVTLTVKPNADKELYDLKITDEDGKAIAVTKVNDTTYTFTMPDGKVIVAATFGCDGGDNCPSKAFTDLGDKQWYHDSIDYAVENGLLEGTSPTTMEPNATLIRAQLAQILYNIEDKPAVTGEMVFEDVPASEWFYSPVLWANQNEIINGTSATTFEPLEDISRQDLALMLYRYAGEPKVTGDLDGFTDAEQVGDWAEEAMAWAVAEGIVQGDTPTTLNPTGTATRAEAAAMLQRFLENAA